MTESMCEKLDMDPWFAGILARSWPQNQLEKWRGTGRWRWEELDENCLARIFARLKPDDKVLSLPFVCKSWYRASLDPLCWRSLDFTNPRIWWELETFEAMFRRQYPGRRPSLAGLLKLSLHRSQRSTTELYLPLPIGNMYGDDFIDQEDLDLVKQECPRIKFFSYITPLCRDLEKFIPEMIENWKNLETLAVRGSMFYINETLAAIEQHCPKFCCLMISDFLHFREEETCTAIVALQSRLKRLVLHQVLLDTNCLMSILDGCKELEELRVEKCWGFFPGHPVKKYADTLRTPLCIV